MGSPAGTPLPVFFYGDYACPYTYVADRSLAALARERPLAVSWRPLAVRPDVRPGPELAATAAELGLPLRVPEFEVDSSEALQAAEFARDVEGRTFPPLHAALFRGLFAEGLDIGRRPVLLELAECAGVDREGLESALEDGRYESELAAAEEEARRYGIHGTPSFLFGRFKLVGAAPLDAMRRAAGRADEERE